MVGKTQLVEASLNGGQHIFFIRTGCMVAPGGMGMQIYFHHLHLLSPI